MLTWLQRDADGKKPLLRELLELGLLIIFVVIPFRMFIATPYIVSGASMSTTYETGHYLIINKLFYTQSGEVKRGDVLVVDSPVDEEKDYIKRVIGLPGETVKIKDGTVTIFSPTLPQAGLVLDEPYTKNQTTGTQTTTLGPEEYFLMGDNRQNSFDSRSWGPLPAANIQGEPFVRLYPFGQIDWMPGRFIFE